MKIQRGVATFVSAALVCALSITVGASSVGAASAPPASDDAQSVAASVDAVTNSVVVDSAGSGGDAVVSDAGPTTVALPADPKDGIEVQTPNGIEVGIGLPGAATADDAVVASDGTVVYSDAVPGASVAAQALNDGSVRALVVISSSDAPTEYRFPIDVPSGGRLEMQPDSSVTMWASSYSGDYCK